MYTGLLIATFHHLLQQTGKPHILHLTFQLVALPKQELVLLFHNLQPLG